MKKPLPVSIVVPVFDEQDSIEELIQRCLVAGRSMGREFELVLIDDGSQDKSVSLIEHAAESNPELVCVVLNRNYGQHAAVLAGFDQSRGDIVVTLDADLQNPPEEIPRLVEKIEEGFDIVGTVRTNRRDSLFRKLSSLAINRAVQKATSVKMHDYGCMLRAYRRPIVEAMLKCQERSTFIPILANSFAKSTTEISVAHSVREYGDSKYSLRKLINLQFDLLTCMTTAPIRLLSVLGAIASIGGIGFGIFLLVMRVAFGSEWAEGGVFTLFAVMFTFIGAQFIGMGLLGEYIGRIYQDVRSRPRFFIDHVTSGSDVTSESRTPGCSSRGNLDDSHAVTSASIGSNP